MAIASKTVIEMIRLSDICYIEADSNYIRFYIKERGMIMLAKTMKKVTAYLASFGFIRVHQSFMLHPLEIQKYDSKSHIIFLRCGKEIPVSRANRKVITLRLSDYSC